MKTKTIFTKPLRMPDSMPTRTTDSIEVTYEDGKVTGVSKIIGSTRVDVLGAVTNEEEISSLNSQISNLENELDSTRILLTSANKEVTVSKLYNSLLNLIITDTNLITLASNSQNATKLLINKQTKLYKYCRVKKEGQCFYIPTTFNQQSLLSSVDEIPEIPLLTNLPSVYYICTNKEKYDLLCLLNLIHFDSSANQLWIVSGQNIISLLAEPISLDSGLYPSYVLTDILLGSDKIKYVELDSLLEVESNLLMYKPLYGGMLNYNDTSLDYTYLEDYLNNYAEENS